MDSSNSNNRVRETLLIFLLLAGCVAPTTAPAPPISTNTPLPTRALPSPNPPTLPPESSPTIAAPTVALPTAVSSPGYVVATTADEILGVWVSGNYYIRFDDDGTFRQAHSLEKLDGQPYAILSYLFEGTEMVITEISVSGVPPCGKKAGRYELRLLENGKLQVVRIKEECGPRGGDFARIYQPLSSMPTATSTP